MKLVPQEDKSVKATSACIVSKSGVTNARHVTRLSLRQKGTVFYRLRTAKETVILVVTLLAYGRPVQAIVMAFGLGERTALSRQSRSGQHCQQVQEHLVEQPRDLGQVQADEIRVKMQGYIVWMAMAIQVPTRLWLGIDLLLHTTQGGGLINTAYLKRLNATFRWRIAALVRRGRALARQMPSLHHGMYLVGTVYNFCTYHKSLRFPLYVPLSAPLAA